MPNPHSVDPASRLTELNSPKIGAPQQLLTNAPPAITASANGSAPQRTTIEKKIVSVRNNSRTSPKNQRLGSIRHLTSSSGPSGQMTQPTSSQNTAGNSAGTQ